jgi:hypothetical protein
VRRRPQPSAAAGEEKAAAHTCACCEAATRTAHRREATRAGRAAATRALLLPSALEARALQHVAIAASVGRGRNCEGAWRALLLAAALLI